MLHSLRPTKFISIILFLTIILAACNLLPQSGPKQGSAPPTIPPAAAQPIVIPPTDRPAEQPPTTEAAQSAPAEAIPTAEPILPSIVHLVFAGNTPPGKPQVIHDQESDRKAEQHEAYGGDEFYRGRYERPFDQSMNYIPVIDIKQANLFRDKDDEFIYTIIHLKEDPALFPDTPLGFGIELDVDIDGRGDILIWTARPLTKDWSVEGVSVWKDLNKSIGDVTPMRNDPLTAGDGYETRIFDAGAGPDPDLAWSRVSAADPTLIELAFKKDLLGETTTFLWGAWSIQGEDPFMLFDHHDHFTFEEAGSPMKSETKYYPLKQMYALDNTCRAASGYTPSGGEPGLCPISAPPPTVKEDEGCVWVCLRQCHPTHFPPGCCEWGCR